MVAWVYVLFHGRSDGRRLRGWRAIGWVLEGTVVSSSGSRRETEAELPRRVVGSGSVAEWQSGPCISGGDQRHVNVNSAATHRLRTWVLSAVHGLLVYWLNDATRLFLEGQS